MGKAANHSKNFRILQKSRKGRLGSGRKQPYQDFLPIRINMVTTIPHAFVPATIRLPHPSFCFRSETPGQTYLFQIPEPLPRPNTPWQINHFRLPKSRNWEQLEINFYLSARNPYNARETQYDFIPSNLISSQPKTRVIVIPLKPKPQGFSLTIQKSSDHIVHVSSALQKTTDNDPWENVLPAEEEQFRLLRIIHNLEVPKKCRDTAFIDLVNKCEKYLGIVARRWHKYANNLEGEHGYKYIKSAAKSALIKAILDWDPGHGKPLSHLMSRLCKYEGMGAADEMSKNPVVFPKPIKRAIAANKARYLHGTDSDKAEILRELQHSNKREYTKNIILTQLENRQSPTLFLDETLPDSDTTVGDTIAASHDQNLANERADIISKLQHAVTAMPSREKFLLYIRHPNIIVQAEDLGQITDHKGDPVRIPCKPCEFPRNSNSYLAEIYGLTAERIRQIDKEVHEKLRVHLDKLGISAESCLALA